MTLIPTKNQEYLPDILEIQAIKLKIKFKKNHKGKKFFLKSFHTRQPVCFKF